MRAIEERIVAVDEILEPWRPKLGGDYPAYRNHVQRMVNFCFALHGCGEEDRQKIIIAGCFHDLGIWSAGTFDYLPPSIALAKEYLKQNGLDGWEPEIELMIGMHHKLRKYGDARYPLVEVFRRGDLVDFSRGILKCGVAKAYFKDVTTRFPNAGFHKRLVQLELGWLPRHPFRPLPVVKW
ncbi:MAG TPA: hypothetical protein VI876_10240 [Dehalococcoidia bacterium]|nr:hypothetical protein [Dehalococcoidia bacterium]